MSAPRIVPVPAGVALDPDSLVLLMQAATRDVVRARNEGLEVQAALLDVLDVSLRALKVAEVVAEQPDPVAELVTSCAPPACWLSASQAAKRAGVSRQALGRRLASSPPSLRGCKYHGANFYDPDSIDEVYG